MTEPAERSPNTLPQSQWSSFIRRVTGVLFRPSEFWASLQHTSVSLRELMFPHLVVLVGLRSGATFIGRMLQDTGLAVALGESIASFVTSFVLVWAFALAAGSVATASGGRMSAGSAVRFAVFGLTPLFAVGILAAIPLPYIGPIAELAAMPYAFYVLALGTRPELGIGPEKAPADVGKLCGALLILWTVMPTLLPALVAVLTSG